MTLSSLVEVQRCLSYFQDSVLIVPFLLLFDFLVLAHSLLLFFVLHLYIVVFVKIVVMILIMLVFRILSYFVDSTLSYEWCFRIYNMLEVVQNIAHADVNCISHKLHSPGNNLLDSVLCVLSLPFPRVLQRNTCNRLPTARLSNGSCYLTGWP